MSKISLIDRIKLGVKLLFYGMKAGDNMMSQKSSVDGNDSEVNHNLTVGGVMSELLQQEETEKVKEIRDEYYRVLKEADKFKVNFEFVKDSKGDIVGYDVKSTTRKTADDFKRHCLVDESDGLKLRLIQENLHTGLSLEEQVDNSNFNKSQFNYKTLITINYDDFTPRFIVDKILTKLVVKEYNNTEAIIDLYFPTFPGQFTRPDACLVSELKKMIENSDYRSEIVNMSSIDFITDGGTWNAERLEHFRYDNLRYQGISVFDGSFVVKMLGHISCDGESVTKKYETDELTKKYKNNDTKNDATDIFVLDRHIGGIDFGKQTFRLNENSD